jgi:hypothetical protein
MAEEDQLVDRTTVINVLQRHGVEVSLLPGQKDVALFVKGDIIEVKILPSEAGRKFLHYLARKFDVPVHHFWNPLMAPQLPGERAQ